MIAVNGAMGTALWTRSISGVGTSSPAVDSAGDIYIGASDGKVYALKPTDGSTLWSFTTGGAVATSPAVGLAGSVYVGSADGKLYSIGGGPVPSFTCVSQTGPGQYAALFGYENRVSTTIHIPAGPQNRLTPTPPAPFVQIQDFPSGSFPSAFWVPFSGQSVTWTLRGQQVTASRTSTGCKPIAYGPPVLRSTTRVPDSESPGVPADSVASRVVPDSVPSPPPTSPIGTIQQPLGGPPQFQVFLTSIQEGDDAVGFLCGPAEPYVEVTIGANPTETRDLPLDLGAAGPAKFEAPVAQTEPTVNVRIRLREHDSDLCGGTDDDELDINMAVDNVSGNSPGFWVSVEGGNFGANFFALTSGCIPAEDHTDNWGLCWTVRTTGFPTTVRTPKVCATWNAAFVDEGAEGVTGTPIPGTQMKEYPASFAQYELHVDGPGGTASAGSHAGANGEVIPEYLDAEGCVPPGIIGTVVPSTAFVFAAPEPGAQPQDFSLSLKTTSRLHEFTHDLTYEVHSQCAKDAAGNPIDVDNDGNLCENPEDIAGGGFETTVTDLTSSSGISGDVNLADWTQGPSVWAGPPERIQMRTTQLFNWTRVSAIASKILTTPDLALPENDTLVILAGRGCPGVRTPGESCAAETAFIGPGAFIQPLVSCVQDSDCGSPFKVCRSDAPGGPKNCAWMDESNWKFIVTHELGHQINTHTFGLFGSDAPTDDDYVFTCPATDPNCANPDQPVGPNSNGDTRLLDPYRVNPMCRCDHVDIANRHHCMNSVERSGDAQVEAIGHWVASMVWNRPDTAAPLFQYYKEVLRPECLSTKCEPFNGFVRSRPPVAFPAGEPQLWRNTWCPMQPNDVPATELVNLAQFGVEADWMGFLYTMVRAGGANAIPSPLLYDIYRSTCSTQLTQTGTTYTAFVTLPVADCTGSDQVQWGDSIQFTGTQLTSRRVGLRDGAQRLFLADGTFSVAEQDLLRRIDQLASDYGVNQETTKKRQ